MIDVVAVFCILMGAAMVVLWTRDIAEGEQIDISEGRLRARDYAGDLFLPHWLAEYGTAAALVAGGIGLLLRTSWAEPVTLLGVGALIYTSTNSLGWALAEKERMSYAGPMIVGLVGGLVSAIVLI